MMPQGRLVPRLNSFPGFPACIRMCRHRPGTGISRSSMSILTQRCFSTMWPSILARNNLPSGVLRPCTPAVWAVVAAMLVHTPAAQPDSPAMERHVQQLGSPVFAEREAATKALEAMGEPALDALRRAAAKSADAEVRRRAKELIKA